MKKVYLKYNHMYISDIGTYEKYVEYLKPLNNLLTTPMMIIGLEPPETFVIEHKKEANRTIGFVKMVNQREE